MLRDVDDAALLRKACKGQEAAFSELYARYQRRIHQYAARMCGSAADDVVQETFLAILKADGYDPSKGTVAGYLFGIARHQSFGVSGSKPFPLSTWSMLALSR